MTKIDLEKYTQFVKGVTSEPSNNIDAMIARLHELNDTGINISLLLTSAIGISAEGGEFSEIVKKAVFQGKPLNEDAINHLQSELSDIMWYCTNAARALNITMDDVIAKNVAKLEARYPGGTFDVHYSENRKDGDI